MVNCMLTEPFNRAKPIIETIKKHNHQAYFVGGCVRDYLLKRPIGDVDISTSASPAIIQKLFKKVIPVGIEHGTVVVIHEDTSYEITTFRVEGGYSDQRHPDSVKFIDQIDKDLERRDFTMNALAMDLSGHIIDLFDGKKDINAKIIRTVGNGYERFKEDPLRILRALRFSSQLGFQIHPETLKQMKEISSDIESLAVERITKEFTKMFAGEYITNGLQYLKISGSYKYLPIFSEDPDLMEQIPKSIQPLYSFGEVIALLHLLNKERSIMEWGKKWKCSNQEKMEAAALVKAFEYFQTNNMDKWLVYKLDKVYYNGFIRIINIFHPGRIDNKDILDVYQALPLHSRKELCVNGNDLIHWFPNIKQGPWIHDMLTKIEKEVVIGTLINNKSDIKDWIKWNPPEVN
ncbi:CCA tRNA nucleotidyltransferase [Oceanobacillus salinisoli]|uniref:CCA tRNA nucleotidyltransferase n=1 Tax=Oceanobacillus salinisoli TaxID=2678611 RepID=UPI001E59EB63|nr:CCA tRNA nucleotidyltransferase [Oceanobacillus salinisoli]